MAQPWHVPWQEEDRYAMLRELRYRVYLVGTGKDVRVKGYGGREKQTEKEREKVKKEEGRKGETVVTSSEECQTEREGW